MILEASSNGLLEKLNRNTKKLNEKCDKHDVYKVSFYGKEMCPQCAKELTQESEEELVEKETERSLNRNRLWLNANSIYNDTTLKKATFESFKEVDDETINNKQKALTIARSYYKGDVFNTILYGRFGTGKSHLAMAIIKQINQHSNVKCQFIAMDEVTRRIKETFNGGDPRYTEGKVVKQLIETDLLVIDDLGAEVGSLSNSNKATDFVSRFLNDVVTGRQGKSTIFTTNASNKRLKDIYDGRIMSRIASGAKTINFNDTEDKRGKDLSKYESNI